MRKGAFDKIFDPNDPERQERLWRRYRISAIAIGFAICGLYTLFQTGSTAPTTPAAPSSSDAPPVEDVVDVEDVPSVVAELVIGNEVEQGRSVLSLITTVEIASDTDHLQHRFFLSVPKNISTGAGDTVPTNEPKITRVSVDQNSGGESLVLSIEPWWKLNFGPGDANRLRGPHTLEIIAEIDGIALFSSSGSGSIIFPVVSPSFSGIDKAQATVALPDTASTDNIACHAWIATFGPEGKPAADRQEISGSLFLIPASGLSKDRRAISFVAPRKLAAKEGIWVQVNW